MNKNNLIYCATDKEIFDVLMSAKRRINEKIILQLAKDRGIFYSSKESREDLISKFSLLTHDFHDLNSIIEKRESVNKVEKITSITLDDVLTAEDIKNVIQEDNLPDVKITGHSKNKNQFIANLQYSEIDYGKTRLVQRIAKEAKIDFQFEEGKTIVRFPANDQVKNIFDKFKGKIEEKKKKIISVSKIEIGEFDTPELRTKFFIYLISNLTNFSIDNVTSIKVERFKQIEEDSESELDDDQNKEEAKQEALAMVKNVALKGYSLLLSEEYQSLIRKGFFITSIIWRSTLNIPSGPKVEFEAAFDDPELGTDFKYAVRGVYKSIDKDEYTKTLRPLDSGERDEYLQLIEEVANKAIETIRKQNSIEPD